MKPGDTTVYVGLSGGVDSSVAAQRLLNDGYCVVGVFIKTWHPEFLVCNEEQERLDAMRVAARLEIPFYTLDASDAYKDGVAAYMIREYQHGRTPNPDVMCNQYVKFGVFLQYALQQGAHKIATGHYARVSDMNGTFHLYRGYDTAKDQSYFLWTLTQEQLLKIYFPIGDTQKNDIRVEATKHALSTASKNDSQGICFLGDIDIKEFLTHYIETEDGNVLNERGEVIGRHSGALFYTIGQRHGFIVNTLETKSLPHYVIAKNVSENTITVSLQKKEIGRNTIVLTHINAIQGSIPSECEAQFRYRQKPFKVQCTIQDTEHGMLTVLDPSIELPSIGQSCVLYNGDECLGGGIINEIL